MTVFVTVCVCVHMCVWLYISTLHVHLVRATVRVYACTFAFWSEGRVCVHVHLWAYHVLTL